MPDHTTRTNKYKSDPFRPQPDLRIAPKSRRHHPITQPRGQDNFCIRRPKCVNGGKCDQCVPLYRLWKERK